MRRVKVDSTVITSLAYNAQTRVLEITFRDSREVYRYDDVPAEEYAAFIASESKGTYLNQVFKFRNYRYVCIS